jgi:hypothetical protein
MIPVGLGKVSGGRNLTGTSQGDLVDSREIRSRQPFEVILRLMRHGYDVGKPEKREEELDAPF